MKQAYLACRRCGGTAFRIAVSPGGQKAVCVNDGLVCGEWDTPTEAPA